MFILIRLSRVTAEISSDSSLTFVNAITIFSWTLPSASSKAVRTFFTLGFVSKLILGPFDALITAKIISRFAHPSGPFEFSLISESILLASQRPSEIPFNLFLRSTIPSFRSKAPFLKSSISLSPIFDGFLIS